MSFSLLQMLTDGLWIIVMFLSAVCTLILTAPIHCRASIAETLMQCSVSSRFTCFQLINMTSLDRSCVYKS